ncbi:MAG TPA: carbamoyltransferase C-terminal domain-containing protein [Candidatus Acidoferrales bacterium]|nr:carbamoyltransferase C-terminal domain-containing protein [Candidatus Acidoferrales bacterium]
MYFLGLSALAHNTAAALLGDAGVVAAIEESKLVRSRDANGIPRAAIHFCMQCAGIGWRDIGAIAVANRPWRVWTRRAAFHSKFLATSPVSSAYYESKAIGELATELNNQRILRLMSADARVPLLAFDHHLCHAASAFYASSFSRALIVTYDEQGGGQSGIVALGDSGKIRVLHTTPFPDSLGWIYSQITELLGFVPHQHEHKTQWLSVTAEPRYLDIFLRMIRRPGSAFPKLDPSFFTRGFAGRLAFSRIFYEQLGITAQHQSELSDKTGAEIASSLQRACEIVITDMVRMLRERYNSDNLCLAGGLFLNPLLVAELEKNAGFAHVFVQPAAGNEGTALGAAYVARQGKIPAPAAHALSHMYLGPSYSNEEIKAVLDNCKATYRWIASGDEIIHQTVKLLLAGKIVGWFHGAAEFGPRALGNRSLLASPWAAYVKENLNDFVKHREPFRPFALSVPEEDASKYFQSTPVSAQFMASMARLRPQHLELLSAYALAQDLVRLHIVKRETNPLYWLLLKAFGAQAQAPVLVNASFNLFGEPLVVSPRDAVRSYFCSGVDALVIGNFMLVKS